MATRYSVPGYGNAISRFHRGRSDNFPAEDLSSFDFDEIRARAREAWLQPHASKTSYRDHYGSQRFTGDERPFSRPSSPTRKNNPHPKLVFLATRLHSVPGYHNADAATEHQDATRPSSQRYARRHADDQYPASRPHTASVSQCSDRYASASGRSHHGGRGTPTEHKDGGANYNDGLEEDTRLRGDANVTSPSYVPMPSLHRYLKYAGAAELKNLSQMTGGRFIPRTIDYAYCEVGRPTSRPRHSRSARGDYVMHPEWPPTITHHRLNGLSAVRRPKSSELMA